VRLTEEAHVLLAHGTLLAAQLERARADVEALRAGRLATVRIGAFGTAIARFVAPALERLAARDPQLALAVEEVEPPASFDALAAHRVDLILAVEYRGGPSRGDRRFHREPLLDDPFVLALPAGHEHARRQRPRLADLADERWIVGTPDHPCWDIVMAACATAGFTPDVAHRVDDWNAVLALVAAGAGVGAIPRSTAPIRQRGLVLRAPVGPAPARSIYAAVRAGSQDAAPIRAVLDALRAAGVDGALGNERVRVG
jgi:DNA-binding transcriptional LysR family regulator